MLIRILALTNWKCCSWSSLWGRLVFRHFDRPSMKKTSKSNGIIKTIINCKMMISEVTFQVLLDATWVQSAKATCRDSRRQRRGKRKEQSSSSWWSSMSEVTSSSTFTSPPILFRNLMVHISKHEEEKEGGEASCLYCLMIEKHKNSTPKGLLLTLQWIPTWKSKTNPKH